MDAKPIKGEETMILTRKLLNKFEQGQRWSLAEELKKFLLDCYSSEEDLYPANEEDLFHWIRKDIQAYEDGDLDIRLKSNEEKLEIALKKYQEEKEFLKKELNKTTNQVYKLKKILEEHNISLPEWCKTLFY